nr:PREDICTED: leucine-rich repeat and IQ domain-containing protein 1 isoform X2 [Lepisosteus oculatus]
MLRTRCYVTCVGKLLCKIMNNRLIEEAIEQELSKICINPSDTEELETFSEDETIFDEEPVPDEIPESVLSCLELVKNRMHNAEQLILQDLEETDCDLIKKDTCGTISNHSEDFWMKLASDYHEDPIKLRERIIHEIEEDESLINQNRPEFKVGSPETLTEQIPDEDKENLEATLANMYLETEKQCLLELEILEKKFKEMEEKRAAELKAKKDQQLKEQREEEEKRRHRQKEFQEELKNIESENMENQNEVDETERKEFEKLQEDLRAQEELIKRLEKTMEEERTAFEEQQATERKRVEDLRRRAATRIQAAVRGFLIRRASAFLLSQRREERKKKKELQLQLEQERREREEKCRRKLEEQKCREEEERKKKDEAERQARVEQEKRRAAYEKAKEEERLRLEEERKLKLEAARQGKKEELRKREELERKIKLDEEDKRKKEVEEKRSEEHRNQEEMEKKRFREFKRRKEEVQNAEQIQEQNVEQILAEKLKGSQFGEFDEFENKGDGTKLNDKLNETLQNNSTDCEKVKDDSGFSDYDVDNKDASVQEISLQSNKKSLNCASEEMPCLEDNEDKTNMENAKKNEGLSQEESEKCHNMEKDLIMSFRPTGCIPEPKGNYHGAPAVDMYSLTNQMCLPECTEQKRLAWMKACTPWSKISMQNKRKEVVKRKVIRRGSAVQLPALSTNTILQSGDWISLQQVTAVTLQDLPGCSLSTLSECTKLQMLTMKRCGLKALEGISGCKDLKYINVQENAIQYINCQGMDNLDVLLLNHNQLASIHGLDGAVNLHALELSHNHITRICGLESLKKLQRLVLSHNQLISTKGLKDTATLLHLDCSYNHLTEIEGIENCALLCTLKLQGNNLTEPPSLVNHVLMKELYIDDNSISSLESLSACWLPLLQVLSLSQNSLTHIPPLLDFLSLKELDVSCNCISELRDVHLSLEGSTNLRELNLTGNPVQQETNWRSSLQKMLPGLKKINGEPISSTQVYLTDRSARPPPGSFLALCQAQLKQLELLLKRHDRELQSILSPLDAPMIRSQQSDELITLAEEHRYAHEYGDLSVNDGDEPETQSNLLMQEGSDRHQHNFPFISKAKENNQVSKDPSTRWITASQVQPTVNCCTVSQEEGNQEGQISGVNAEISSLRIGESKRRMVNDKRERSDTAVSCQHIEIAHGPSRLLRKNIHHCQYKDIKIIAAVVIQSHWRGHLCRRNIRLLLAQQAAALVIQSAWRKYSICRNNWNKDSSSHTCISKDICLDIMERAAIVIQATWKGYVLRKKLASALAAVKTNEVDDDFEEVNMEDFAFDEAALEKEWITLDSKCFPSKMLPLSDQLYWPKPPSHQAIKDKNMPVVLCNPKQAWLSEESEKMTKEQQNSSSLNPESSSRRLSSASRAESALTSEKEKLLEEWGIKDSYTAHLILRRAHKMKSKKQQQKKLLDPAVRLALFKSNENKHTPVKLPKKMYPPKLSCFKGFLLYNEIQKDSVQELAPSDTIKGDQSECSKERTYQWLHTQVVISDTSSSFMKSDRFLPEIDPDVLNGGRVQLVASPVSREGLDQETLSMASGSALTQPCREYNQTHRHSVGRTTNKVPVPVRVESAPSKKERISFRDNPVQLSTGWGGGKKRTRMCK